MNVQQKIANVLIVERTIVQRSIHERERLVLGGVPVSLVSASISAAQQDNNDWSLVTALRSASCSVTVYVLVL